MKKKIEIRKNKGMFYIKLNFLGGIETFTNSKDDIDTAISEAIILFVQTSNKYGKGIRKELEMLK